MPHAPALTQHPVMSRASDLMQKFASSHVYLTSHEDDYSATVEKEERLVAALPYSMNADRDAVQILPIRVSFF